MTIQEIINEALGVFNRLGHRPEYFQQEEKSSCWTKEQMQDFRKKHFGEKVIRKPTQYFVEGFDELVNFGISRREFRSSN